MIGRFSYSCDERPLDVLVELKWQDNVPGGVVHPPDWVFEKLGPEFAMRPADEFMRLPFALSYGVLVASAAGAVLTICGDRTAWQVEWGALVDRPPGAVIIPHLGKSRSH